MFLIKPPGGGVGIFVNLKWGNERLHNIMLPFSQILDPHRMKCLESQAFMDKTKHAVSTTTIKY